jgi:hypothetical protein
VGPSAGCATLTPSGSLTISKPGQTVQNLNVTGTITVTAANVTITNVCVTDDAEGNINSGPVVHFESTGGLIEHATVSGANATNQSVEVAVGGGGTASHDYFYNCGECVHDSGWNVSDSYVNANGDPYSGGYSGGVGQGAEDHHEDVYCNRGSALIRHDTLLNPFNSVATLFCDTSDGGACSNHVTMTDNLMVGGGFLLYACGNASSVGTSTMNISHNRFARCTTPAIARNSIQGGYACEGDKNFSPGSGADHHGYWPYGGYYGVHADTYCPPERGQTWSANVWDDNGAGVKCS